MNMNSHFKKISKGTTGKIGVWDITKNKIKNKIYEGILEKHKT